MRRRGPSHCAVLLALAGCAVPAGAPVRPAPDPDAALWTALGGWAATLAKPGLEIRVHPVFGPPEPDPHRPAPTGIAPGDSAAVRARRAALAGHGIGTTDAAKDVGCLWARGLPPPPQPGGPPPEPPISGQCRAMDRYRAVVFSRPWRAGDGTERVRAFVLLNYGFETFDLQLARSRTGWTVARATRVFGIMS